jgi:hypothetical protein
MRVGSNCSEVTFGGGEFDKSTILVGERGREMSVYMIFREC